MLGAIYGDKAGSIYEFGQLKEITSIDPKELILPNSFYSDDTIETIAVIDAIINNRDYEQTLREYILDNIEYKPNFKPYFKNSFSPGAIKWAKGIGRNNSSGNGAMMRISPVGYLFNSEKDVTENARLVTITSHNSKEAIESATIIALKLNLLVKYESFVKFNTTCRETLGNCLYAIYNSNSFEDSIRKTLLMGGDTDTNCCIVGSVTESLYGMNDIQKKDAISNLPKEYVKVLKKVYE